MRMAVMKCALPSIVTVTSTPSRNSGAVIPPGSAVPSLAKTLTSLSRLTERFCPPAYMKSLPFSMSILRIVPMASTAASGVNVSRATAAVNNERRMVILLLIEGAGAARHPRREAPTGLLVRSGDRDG